MRRVWCISALIGLGVSALAVADDQFGAFAVTPEARVFHVGSIAVTSLHDARYVVPNDAKVFGVDVGAATVGEELRASGAPTDRITLSVNALLVKTGKRLVLLDTGLGPKMHGMLLQSLQEAGVKPAQITDVLITHSHGDHIGGLVDSDGHVTFPHAAIRMSKAEWDFLQKHGPADVAAAISKHVHPFVPGDTLAPGITAIALDGHTPGHVGYEIVSGSARLLDIGDMAHSSIVSLHHPQWSVSFDNDGAVAKTTRLTTLARLARDQELVFAPHFPYPGIGHVVARGDGFDWQGGATMP